MTTYLRSSARAVLPDAILVARNRRVLRKTRRRYGDADNAEIFSTIYAGKMWGAEADFNSGPGSHDPAILGPYVGSVTEFLSSLGTPDVVDLGCGDFSVGVQLRPVCGRYVACDVVADLIERNRRLTEFADVEFCHLDITSDDVPGADVVILRQVLQHLSNDDIAKVIPKLDRYAYAIITDHQPIGKFLPNRNIPTGHHTRLALRSAVDLTRGPFHLAYRDVRELCCVGDASGVIRTTLLRLR